LEEKLKAGLLNNYGKRTQAIVVSRAHLPATKEILVDIRRKEMGVSSEGQDSNINQFQREMEN